MSFVKPMFFAWSYSRISNWEGCHARAKYKFIDKLPEPDSPYAARGGDIHKLAERYLKGELTELPAQLNQVDEYIEDLKVPGVQTELQLAFTKEWKPTGWFARDVYCRVIYDAVVPADKEVTVTDHKTGKKREAEHIDQLRLYALTAFMQWPEVDKVNAQVLYVDHGERLRMVFHRDTVPELLKYWDDRAAKMLADDIFAAIPNPGCKWCHYRKSNGGPCQFN